MAALLGLSPDVLFLLVTQMVLEGTTIVGTIVMLIVFSVRYVALSRSGSNAPSRAGDINIKPFIAITMGLFLGFLAFWGIGMFTNHPLLGGLGTFCLEVFLIYVVVTALRWVRYF